MMTDFPDPHAPAFEAAAAVALAHLQFLQVMVKGAIDGALPYQSFCRGLQAILPDLLGHDPRDARPFRTEPVNPADPDGPLRVVFFADQSSAPKSWADIRTVEEAIVWVSAATAEELCEMAARLLADHPLSRAEVVPQQAILRATLASEKLSRRVMRAAQAVAHPKRRSRRRAVDQGDQE